LNDIEAKLNVLKVNIRVEMGRSIALYIICIFLCFKSLHGEQTIDIKDAQSKGQVIHVTTESSSDFLTSKVPVVLEFYAPWCGHCKSFTSHYNGIAQALGSSYRVGSSDIDTNPAFAARFDVHAVPTIFLYRDGQVWRYEGPLLQNEVVSWAKDGYKRSTPISFWTSPMGPMGISKGFLIQAGIAFVNLLPFLTKTFGLPPWIGFVLVTIALGMVILVVTFIGVYLSIHAKQD